LEHVYMSTLAVSPGTGLSVEEFRQLAFDELRPFDREADATRTVPATAQPALTDALRLITSLDELNDPTSVLAAVEALAFGSPTLAHAVLPKIQASLLLTRLGTNEQRAANGPLLLDPSKLSAILITESHGRGPTEWETIATRSGNSWLVNGRKTAVHGGIGTGSLLVAVDEAGDVVAFLQTGATPAWPTPSESAPSTMALGASRLGSVQLVDVALNERDRLSGAADKHFVGSRAVAYARLLVGAVALGAAEASMAYARDWVVARHAFGKPLAAFEGVAFDIADHDTRLSMARLSLAKAAHDVHQCSSCRRWGPIDGCPRHHSRAPPGAFPSDRECTLNT
jgi:alkylation response protein AidB-like acyl-CoA dehydrogenase